MEKTEKVEKLETSLEVSDKIGLTQVKIPFATGCRTEILDLPRLSEFLDYRKYLASYYDYRRKLSENGVRPYNYGVFSASANIKSPNYLKMIIEGKRNLSESMVHKFAKALNLNKEQTEEFRLLVLFSQSMDPSERNIHLKELNEYRVRSKLKAGEIDKKTWEKAPSWVSWILYAMIDQEGVQFQPEHLRHFLRGMVTQDEVSEALKSMLAGGQVVQDDVTKIFSKAANVSNESSGEIPVALVRKLQAELMYLGMESLFRDAPTDREFGSLTLALTKAEFEELRFQLRKFRKQTQRDNSVRRMTSKGEQVYQMNLQLFPVTEKSL